MKNMQAGELSALFQAKTVFLMEGALGERLKAEYGLAIDGPVAMASLVRQEAGRRALAALWREYLAMAQQAGLPFLATIKNVWWRRDMERSCWKKTWLF